MTSLMILAGNYVNLGTTHPLEFYRASYRWASDLSIASTALDAG